MSNTLWIYLESETAALKILPCFFYFWQNSFENLFKLMPVETVLNLSDPWGHKLIFKVSVDRFYDNLICDLQPFWNLQVGENDAAAASVCAPENHRNDAGHTPPLHELGN